MADHQSTTTAVYNATASHYARVVGTEISAQFETSADRALLADFIDVVARTPKASLVDIGCGVGRVAAFAARRGVDVVGVDPSVAMLEIARGVCPEARFEVGELAQLPLDDGYATAAIAWYSIIHTPLAELLEGFVETRRVLALDAPILVAFQAGRGEAITRPNAYDSGLVLTHHRHDPNRVAEQLRAAGFDITGVAVREPEFDHETTPQAFITATAIGVDV